MVGVEAASASLIFPFGIFSMATSMEGPCQDRRRIDTLVPGREGIGFPSAATTVHLFGGSLVLRRFLLFAFVWCYLFVQVPILL